MFETEKGGDTSEELNDDALREELGESALMILGPRDLMSKADVLGNRRVAALYLLAYNFMLRVPSEGLPVVMGACGTA